MTSLRRSLLILAVSSLAGFGCGDVTNPGADGGSDGGGGGGDGGGMADANTGPDAFVDPCVGNVDYDDFWQCAMDVVCNVFVGCLGDGIDNCDDAANQVFIFGNYPLALTEPLFTEAIAAGTMTYNGAAAGACFAQLANQQCWELFASEPFENCDIFTGTVGPGGMCFHEEECVGNGPSCQQNMCGGGQDVCCVGQCQASVPVGGNCSAAQCEPGAYCRNSICQAGVPGNLCDGDYQCDDENHCAPSGQCAADLPSGSVCANDQACQLPQSCLGNNLQQSTMGNCGNSFEAGDSCDQSGCLAFGTLFCDQPNPNALGTCRAMPLLGESCAASGTCGFFLECDQTTEICVERGSVGTACTTGDCNFFLFCDTEITTLPNGLCTAPGLANAQCTNGSHCQSGLCLTGQCADYPGCFP